MKDKISVTLHDESGGSVTVTAYYGPEFDSTRVKAIEITKVDYVEESSIVKGVAKAGDDIGWTAALVGDADFNINQENKD